MWQSKAQASEQALVASKQASGSHNFILVLIDGDGAIFQDYLYAMGKDGGAEAAHQLHSTVQQEVKATYPDAISDWSIVVQVVLNLQGLATKLQSLGIISNANELAAFGRALGLAQPLFNIIDVGNGKERADHKLREMLRLYLPISQASMCSSRIAMTMDILPYSNNTAVASRLTLIETRPAEPGFRQLGFKMCSMSQVFRSSDLPMSRQTLQPPAATTMRTPMSTHTNAMPFIPKPGSPAPSTESVTSAGGSTWGTVAKGSGLNANKFISIASKKTPARRFILLNVDDERLDEELPRTDPGAEGRYAKRMEGQGKCCNSYHLTGKCSAGDYCDYVHGEKLTKGEVLVLKHKARSRSCPQRLWCRDIDCAYGHSCKFGDNCYSDACYFADSHGMNKEPAKRYFEDGTEEWMPSFLNKTR
ncbi:uncharacterized protein RCC_02398 [Ramularia collo-cygni]|uniref:C3H1-type domain-containing protein n=1 Tax=Ramularia collo-cygni TaxID=112498 RepID=A0A2D3V255_9PEZI|nr:uncharacterized protein RCC_02398 [Ramularia collo-cygni]CZT16564.1 uncharacterized protein RCC_02398 [Ramularia collo-cygni]